MTTRDKAISELKNLRKRILEGEREIIVDDYFHASSRPFGTVWAGATTVIQGVVDQCRRYYEYIHNNRDLMATAMKDFDFVYVSEAFENHSESICDFRKHKFTRTYRGHAFGDNGMNNYDAYVSVLLNKLAYIVREAKRHGSTPSLVYDIGHMENKYANDIVAGKTTIGDIEEMVFQHLVWYRERDFYPFIDLAEALRQRVEVMKAQYCQCQHCGK